MKDKPDNRASQACATVAIVGRPNVGKSSLFNLLAKRRISIVDARAGITRDRVSTVLDVDGLAFELVDTGGMGFSDDEALTRDVNRQIRFALESADVVVFVVDAQEGLMPLDRYVSEQLRPLGKPVILVANKADNPQIAAAAAEFYVLGFAEAVVTSVTHSMGRSELLERIARDVASYAHGTVPRASEKKEGPLKLAIVGKRNAGKSTLVNLLAGADRQIVSELPGTTRDSVDVPVVVGGRDYILIDTAGVRRRRGVPDSVSFYGQVRTEGAIRRADVVLFVMDATTEVSQVDKKITHYVLDHYKPVVMMLNKWDLVTGATMDQFRAYIEDRLVGLDFAPIAAASARTGFNVREVMTVVEDLYRQARARVATHKINEIVGEAFSRRAPRPVRNRIGNLRYATQTGVAPPTVVLFVNDPKLFPPSYARYLQNRLREACPYSEIPVRIEFRRSGKKIAHR